MLKHFPTDDYFMAEALKLAKKGLGRTNPNPAVGAVIVKDGEIIARGYHRKAGGPHAEIEALRAAEANVKGSTLYVTLEPCSHYGKTPPCADAIIKAGIRKVVCSTRDPNPKVHGRGIAKLQRAGIAVSVGLREKEAKEINEPFFTFHKKRRPFVVLKFAASLDGKLATRNGDSKWITNERARTFARSLRTRYQAVLVGIDTVLHDDPNLGTRHKSETEPLRVILDSKLRIPMSSHILRDSNVLVATTPRAPKGKKALLEKKGIKVLTFSGAAIPLPKLLSALRERGVISVFVEGGGKVLGSFLDARLVDKVYAFYAPVIIGGGRAVAIGGVGADTVARGLRLDRVSVRRFGDNMLVTGYPRHF